MEDEEYDPNDPIGALQSSAPTQGEFADYAAKHPEAAPLMGFYNNATKRLRDQRAGLTTKEKLKALLIGFSQPTQHGNWREGVANGVGLLQQQTMLRRREDQRREELLAKYGIDEARAMMTMGIADARLKGAAQTAEAKAAQGAIQVGQNPNTGELYAARKRFVNGQPVVERLPVGAGEGVPTISTPQEGAQHPDAPIVNTPMGPMANPYYKGG